MVIVAHKDKEELYISCLFPSLTMNTRCFIGIYYCRISRPVPWREPIHHKMFGCHEVIDFEQHLRKTRFISTSETQPEHLPDVRCLTWLGRKTVMTRCCPGRWRARNPVGSMIFYSLCKSVWVIERWDGAVNCQVFSLLVWPDVFVNFPPSVPTRQITGDTTTWG